MNNLMELAAKESLEKVRTVLKEAFPETDFTVLPSEECFLITWFDGPQRSQVDEVLRRLARQEMVRLKADDQWMPVGYTWAGVNYVGARYLDTLRQFSPGRRAQIARVLTEKGIRWNEATADEIAEVEWELVVSGAVRDDPTDVPIDPVPEPPEPESAGNVIAFPGMGMEKQFVDQFMDGLSREQKLKLLSLHRLLGEEALHIVMGQVKSVDELFERIAARLFPD